MKHQSVVIIGGGVGGLFTGAFLAKNGLTVTVLEKIRYTVADFNAFREKGRFLKPACT